MSTDDTPETESHGPCRTAGAAAARRGRVSAHGHPAVRRPREIDPRARPGDALRQADPAGRAEAGGRRRSGRAGPVSTRHGRDDPAAAQASRRHRQGAGRGRRARQDREAAHRPVLLGRSVTVQGRRAVRRARDGRAGALGHLAVRAVRQAEPQGAAGGAHRARRHRAAGPARRQRRRAHVAQARRQAEGARDPGRAQAPGAHPRADRRRDGRAADREAHPRPRQAADGEEPARVLPQRADEGDPEGAGRDRGRAERARGAGAAHPEGRHAEGSARQGDVRAQQAEAHVADVRRGDRGAQLRRLAGEVPVEEEDQGAHRHRSSPRRCSTRITTVSRR